MEELHAVVLANGEVKLFTNWSDAKRYSVRHDRNVVTPEMNPPLRIPYLVVFRIWDDGNIKVFANKVDDHTKYTLKKFTPIEHTPGSWYVMVLAEDEADAKVAAKRGMTDALLGR